MFSITAGTVMFDIHVAVKDMRMPSCASCNAEVCLESGWIMNDVDDVLQSFHLSLSSGACMAVDEAS